ncbi:MAG: glucose-6-phosphate isomerase [Negativicutes bacterium]|nr:glucose-6-phosphate isomerase [Negativicutes bacterium]MDR3590941.1 glucose-6-phosphate isomerase [Negativicutes bacterium]
MPANELRLATGFTFDYSNLYGPGKVTTSDCEELAPRIAAAQAAIERMRAGGEVRGHLSKDGTPEKVLFSQLPYVAAGNLNSPQSITRLKEFGQSVRHNVDAVIHFGIGGSYLGNKVLFDIHCGEFWNSKDISARNGYPKLYFSGNNIDPARTVDLVDHIAAEAGRKEGACYKVMLVVVSKSGSTLDTMSAFMVVYGALKDRLPDGAVSVVAVTDPAEGEQATLLKKLAGDEGWPTFAVPDGVGGRFSIFSEVGLVTAACIGLDIDAFLAGARGMDEACRTGDMWANPALLNAVLKYLAAEKYGRDIEVFMPYGDYLKSIAEWYIQLLAESLGKRRDRQGREIFYGRTPIVAVGTTDMHAQTQQHQDGKKNKVVQFVKIAQWQSDPVIPDAFPAVKPLAQFASLRMSQALDTALEANAAALSSDNRFNAALILPRLDAYHLGELLYMLALSVAYEGELADVDAFDQPGVEAYKKIMGPMLTKLKNG